MKRIILLSLCILYYLVPQAQVLLIDKFDYPVASGLVGLGGWVIEGTSTTNPIQVTASTPLIYTGYSTTAVGNEISLTNSGQDVSRTFTAQTSGTIYYSCLVNISSAKSAGDYFIHLVSSSAFIGQIYIKLDGSKIAFGILNATGGTAYSPNYTSSIYDLSTTYLLVAKVDISTGTSSIIVDPEISAIEPSTGWISSSTPTNGGTGGTTVPSASGINKINLRQGTATSAPILKLDEIHVAMSYNSAITSILSPHADILNVLTSGKKLTVTNSPSNTIEIFNTVGAKLQSVELINGSADLSLAKGLYIVRAGKATAKIML